MVMATFITRNAFFRFKGVCTAFSSSRSAAQLPVMQNTAERARGFKCRTGKECEARLNWSREVEGRAHQSHDRSFIRLERSFRHRRQQGIQRGADSLHAKAHEPAPRARRAKGQFGSRHYRQVRRPIYEEEMTDKFTPIPEAIRRFLAASATRAAFPGLRRAVCPS